MTCKQTLDQMQGGSYREVERHIPLFQSISYTKFLRQHYLGNVKYENVEKVISKLIWTTRNFQEFKVSKQPAI